MPASLELEVNKTKKGCLKKENIEQLFERLSQDYSIIVCDVEIKTLGEMKQMRRGLRKSEREFWEDECWYVKLKCEPNKLPEYLPTEFWGLRIFYETPVDGR